MTRLREEIALFLVPTPIGNLEDMTFRSVNVLKEVDLILAEDTRKSAILLKHYGITTPMHSHHAFNEHKTVSNVVAKLKEGKKIALITDAGTPGISDPGFLLIRECLKEALQVECLPGATAFVPALVNSGLPSDSFVFEGFIPQKKGRQTKIIQMVQETRTVVFYESPHRLIKALEQLKEHAGGQRKASVSRELTKIYEETISGTLDELLQYYQGKTIKGEIVVVLSGRNEKDEITDEV